MPALIVVWYVLEVDMPGPGMIDPIHIPWTDHQIVTLTSLN